MPLRIGTNLASLNAQRHLLNATYEVGLRMGRLSSGLRIRSASDDPAGLAISERMRAQLRGLTQAHRNAQDGISAFETAEGTANEIAGNLTRMRELAVQASNGTLSDGDREALDQEFQDLADEIDSQAASTDFNGNSLLDGSDWKDLLLGTEATDFYDPGSYDLTAGTLGIDTLDVASTGSAGSALAAIDSAIDSVSSARAQIGARINSLQSRSRSLLTQHTNLSAAESRIRDADLAAETAGLLKAQILQQSALAVLAQANTQPQIALQLLQAI